MISTQKSVTSKLARQVYTEVDIVDRFDTTVVKGHAITNRSTLPDFREIISSTRVLPISSQTIHTGFDVFGLEGTDSIQAKVLRPDRSQWHSFELTTQNSEDAGYSIWLPAYTLYDSPEPGRWTIEYSVDGKLIGEDFFELSESLIPELSIRHDGQIVTEARWTHYDFPTGSRGAASPSLNFMIENHGGATLEIHGVELPEWVTLSVPPPSEIQPGGSVNIEILASTERSGRHWGQVAILTNDESERRSTFQVESFISEPSAMATRLGLSFQYGIEGTTVLAKLYRSFVTNQPLTFDIYSSSPKDVVAPETVTIPANMPWVMFPLEIVNDDLPEALTRVTINAQPRNASLATSAELLVIDDDLLQEAVSLSFPSTPVSENRGEIIGTLTRHGDLRDSLTVNLFVDKPTLARTPLFVTIPAFHDSAPFTLTAIDNLDFSSDQSVSIIASVFGVATAKAMITIANDDLPPSITLSRNNGTIAEAAGTSIITATLSAASSLPVTINLGFTGTATVSSDYTRTATQIVIPAGQTTGTVTVTAVQDTLDEVDETIVVDITDVTNGTEATPQQVTVTITDDDVPPTVTLSRSNAAIAESAGTAVITATLSAVSSLPVTVDLDFTGSAMLTSDYTRSSTQIVIAPGQTTGSVTITAVQDTLDEVDETIIVDISSVINGTEATPQQVTVTITDDDAPPTVTLSRNNATIAEAAGTSVITATLSAVSSLPVTVDLDFTGSAMLTSDYTRSSTQIVIAPGQTTGSVTITAVQDTLDEVDELIIVDITAVTNGTEATAQQVTVTITDDDAAPTVTISHNNATIAEAAGTSVITATLSAVSSLPVTVNLGFAGTATLTSDYTRTGTQIVIAPGQTAGSVTITAVQDSLDEVGETIIVDITAVTNGTEATPQQVTVTIVDDDAPPTVTLSRNNAAIAEAAGTSIITATLSALSSLPVTIDLGFAGTATLTSDYTRSGTQIVIPAGQTTGSVTITAVQDTLDEVDETIIVDITNVTNGTEATPAQQVTVTITDDDAAPTVTISRNNATIAEAAGAAIITATISAASSLPVTIDLGFAGSATLTSDYTRSDTQIVIAPGQTMGSVTVTAVQDLIDEVEETIVVDIASVINGTESTPAPQVTVTITDDDEPLDFGDAPAAYPVTLAQNGARHTVSPLFLGENIDDEVDGIPSVNAESDDGDDGVVILSTFISSTVATTSSVSVIASRPGKLDAWIDFNNDGDWSDAGEQIFSSTDVVAGVNLLSFTVPARATSGSTGARFRLSTAGGLAPTGAAADGEVEDYLAVIVAGSTTAALRIDVPSGDTNAVVEGDDLVVRKGTTIISQVPFASFGELSLNGSPLDDILQLTILEAFATMKLVIDGGLGRDFLELVEAGQTLDLTDANVTVREIEGIDIRGTGDNQLVISIDSVKAAASTTSTLEVVSNAGDTITFGDDWRVDLPQFIDGQFSHVISERAAGGTARVEVRNDRFFTNPLNRFDVDRNGTVQPLDALRIINAIRRLGSGPITLPTNDGEISNLYFDVSGDNNLTALDALRVINAISRINRGVEPEGESALQPVDLDAFAKDTIDQRDVIDTAISEFETPAVATSFGSVQPPQPSVTNIDDWMEEFGTDESAEDIGLTSKLSEKMSAPLSSEAD